MATKIKRARIRKTGYPKASGLHLTGEALIAYIYKFSRSRFHVPCHYEIGGKLVLI